jgi:transposase
MEKAKTRKPRRVYAAEYKKAAVELVTVSGRSFGEAAKSLDISEPTLRKWKAALDARGDKAFPGHGVHTVLDDELARLRAENDRLRMERDILKKAAAFFARDSG